MDKPVLSETDPPIFETEFNIINTHLESTKKRLLDKTKQFHTERLRNLKSLRQNIDILHQSIISAIEGARRVGKTQLASKKSNPKISPEQYERMERAFNQKLQEIEDIRARILKTMQDTTAGMEQQYKRLEQLLASLSS